MPTVIGNIIAISRSVKKYSHLLDQKNNNRWNLLQNKLRVYLKTSFGLADDDLVDYSKYLHVHYIDIVARLSQVDIRELEMIVLEMRAIEMFLKGKISGFNSHSILLGNYDGLLYRSAGDCPLGGESDDCDLIVVSRVGSMSDMMITHLADYAGKLHEEKIESSKYEYLLGQTPTYSFSHREKREISVISLLHG
jgi:hypothetical protein